MYWLLHHDTTGRRRTSEHVAAVMLSAAVLAELTAADHACILDEQMAAHVPVTATDALHARVLAQIIAEDARYPLRQWLEFLSDGMCDHVAERMVSAGRARRHGTVLHRSRVIANAGDQSPAWVHAGLIDALRRGHPLDGHQLFLLSLAQHSNMNEHPLSAVKDDMRIRYALSQLARMPTGWQQLADTAADLIRAAAITR